MGDRHGHAPHMNEPSSSSTSTGYYPYRNPSLESKSFNSTSTYVWHPEPQPITRRIVTNAKPEIATLRRVSLRQQPPPSPSQEQQQSQLRPRHQQPTTAPTRTQAPHRSLHPSTSTEADEEQDESSITADGRNYVNMIAKKYGKRPYAMETRPLSIQSSSDEAILRRLTPPHILCNPYDMSCLTAMCGRTFTSLSVLAFHMSYAHQDLLVGSLTCLVCGLKSESSKGKIAHLISRHKVISIEHSSQCMDQREPVISPLAPAALRLIENGSYDEDCDYQYYGATYYEDQEALDDQQEVYIPYEADRQ